MKEFLATGVVVMMLTLFSVPSVSHNDETNLPENIPTNIFEGFVPHDCVTTPPVQENVPADDLLPDFGSQAYL
jgi:hypothetical protein